MNSHRNILFRSQNFGFSIFSEIWLGRNEMVRLNKCFRVHPGLVSAAFEQINSLGLALSQS